MSESLVIGIDVSTTSCKAIAWDRHGRALAGGRAAYPTRRPAPKRYEQDAKDWWLGACTALRELLEQIDVRRVEALCVAHQRESFVPVDRTGEPLRPAILWMDERSRDQIPVLHEAIGADPFHHITGKPLTPNPSATKILWLAHHEPELLSHSFKLLDTHAFLVHRLTGTFRTSLASADATGLVDIRAHDWSPDLLRALKINAGQLPELYPPGATLGRVTSQAAQASGLPAGLPVVAGAGDGQCAGLGANAGGGRVSLNLGTAVVGGRMNAGYLVSRAFRTLYAALPGAYFLETVIQAGAFTVDWFIDAFGHALARDGTTRSPQEMLEAEAAQVPPGALGLLLVPYWNHAMTPYWDPHAAGITVGWTGAHRRGHFFRAILEGIAYEQRLAGEALAEATGEPIHDYVALGGGSRSPLWCQILADVTGVPISRCATVEATCLGAGILAATAAGWYAGARQAASAMSRVDSQFTPDTETQGLYEQIYQEIYRPLYPTLRALIHRLGELTRTP
jgi:sugar (pentulose or hexulose) kinase